MAQGAQAGKHAPAEDLEEHVTTGVAPEWDGPTAKRRGGRSLAKAHRRREPNSLGHPDHFFALQQ